MGAGGVAFFEDFFFGISSSSTARACLFTTKPDFLFLSDAFFFAFSAEKYKIKYKIYKNINCVESKLFDSQTGGNFFNT